MSDTVTYDTLRSRPPRHQGAPQDVPPLGISLDADQLRYLRERTHGEEDEGGLNTNEANRTTSETSQMNVGRLMATTKEQLYVALT